MHQRKIILSIFATLSFALAGITLWLTEIIWQVGWSSFGWLWADQYAIFGINLFLVLAYLLPVHFLVGLSWKKILWPGLELYFVGIIAFFISKSILYTLFSPVAIFSLSSQMLWVMLAALVLTTTGSYYYITRNHLYPVRVAFLPLMIGVELLAALLSLLSVYLFLGIDHLGKGLMEATKMGLPFLFIILLFGVFSIFSVEKLRTSEKPERQDEILDDVEFPG